MSNFNAPFYLTAYDLAVKRGFKGSETEWLDSLTAYAMAKAAGYGGTSEEWIQVLVDPVPELTIGEVTTLDGGSRATAVLRGDKRKPVLDLGIPRGLGMTDAMPLVGGTMKGAILMGGFRIGRLPEPVETDDAATKAYADRKLDKTGGAMTGPVSMNGYAVTNLPEPAEGGDAATKDYADRKLDKTGGAMTGYLDVITPVEKGHAVNKGYVDTVPVKASLTAAGWAGTEAPYTQSITVAGLSDTRRAIAYPAYSGSLETDRAMREACGCVSYAVRSGSVITFYCLDEKPGADIDLIVEVGV